MNISNLHGIEPVASKCPEVLPSVPVGASQLLGAALDVLFRARATTAQKAESATGIAQATLSKFRTGDRWPNAGQFDKLSVFFGVPPHVLLRPDEAMAGRDSDSSSATGAHVIPSRSPLDADGGAALMKQPDQELLAALVAFWADCTPEGRLELVGHGHRLRKAATSAVFRAG